MLIGGRIFTTISAACMEPIPMPNPISAVISSLRIVSPPRVSYLQGRGHGRNRTNIPQSREAAILGVVQHSQFCSKEALRQRGRSNDTVFVKCPFVSCQPVEN